DPGTDARLLEQAAPQRHAGADRARRSLAGAASGLRPRHGRRSSHGLHLPGGGLLQSLHQSGRAGLWPHLAAEPARPTAGADAAAATAAAATLLPARKVLAMIKAIRFEKTGGSDVLQYVDYDLPAPAAGQVQVRHTAIGVNFIDTYHRTGLYALPLPSGLGSEAAGVVAAVGEGVTRFKVGDRVGYASGVIGSYAQANTVSADRLVRLPD